MRGALVALFAGVATALLRGGAFREAHPPPVHCTRTNVAVALYEHQRILVLQRSSAEAGPGGHGHANEWNLPGGTIEAGETSEQAVVRECAEEANLSVSNLVFLRDYVFAPGKCVGVWRVDHDGAVEIDADSSAFRWISEDELGNFVFLKPQEQVLHNLFQSPAPATALIRAGDLPPTAKKGFLPDTPGRPFGSTSGSLAYLPLD